MTWSETTNSELIVFKTILAPVAVASFHSDIFSSAPIIQENNLTKLSIAIYCSTYIVAHRHLRDFALDPSHNHQFHSTKNFFVLVY